MVQLMNEEHKVNYYRAALAAANTGDLTTAKRLASCCEILQQENRAAKLLELIEPQITLVREHNIRGLNYAKRGHYRRALKQFDAATRLDCGNLLARQAQLACRAAKKRWFFW